MNLLLITHFITIISMYVIYGWVWGGEFKIPALGGGGGGGVVFLKFPISTPPPPPKKKRNN